MAKKKKEITQVSENKTKKLHPAAAIVIGAVLLILGTVFTLISLSQHITEIGAVEMFDDKAYFRKGAVVDSDYNGHAIVTSGEIVYDAPGATDTVFGVTADSPLLYRVSEMAQWKEENGEINLVWSEELLPSPNAEHENPSSYPSNSKSNYYTALAVMVGDYTVSVEQLLMLEEKEPLSSLPEVDVRGFKTVGEYITNSANIDSPSVGDVRIRYEYITADVVTLAGKQRDTNIVSHTNYNDVPLFATLSGEYTRAEMVSYFRGEAAGPVWWLLILSVIAVAAGSVILFDGFTRATKYAPTFNEFGKSAAAMKPETVKLIYSLLFGIIAIALIIAITWSAVYPIWVVITVFAAFIYFYILIADMIKNMPRRVKKEAEYVPILVKREDRKK